MRKPCEIQQVDDKKLLIENPQEQAALKLAVTLRNKGESLHEIARILTRQGFQPRGKRWYAKSLDRVIKTELEHRA